MITTTPVNFTDPQGNTWTEAVFDIAYANEYSNSNEALKIDMNDMSTFTTDTNLSRSIDVRYYYWPTQAARDAGIYAPYILANVNDGTQPATMSFNFDAGAAEYDGMTLMQRCFHYLETYVLV